MPVLDTPFSESQAAPSPDGRSIAYVSDESGRNEVYVRTFPEPGARLQVSSHGGVAPVWSQGGRGLCYLAPAGASETNVTFGRRAVYCVETTSSPRISASAPRLLFTHRGMQPQTFEFQDAGFDLSPDGQGFLMLVPRAESESMLGQLVVVLNWFQELNTVVPTGRQR